MSAQVTVEQLLIGWSRTSNGKNVLARSPGWPTGPSRSEWVSLLGDFLHSATDKIVRRTGEVPWLLEFQPSSHGSILMAKVYAADSQRAGEFQVHALLDPSRILGPQHLLGLAESGVLLRERPTDVTRLETRTVTIPEVDAPKRVRPVAAALRFLHRGGPLLIQAETLAGAADLLGELAAALPAPVAAKTPARSVVIDTAKATGIAVAVPPWSLGVEAAPTLDQLTVADAYLELAEQVLAGDLALPETEAAAVADWLDLALLDLDALTMDDLARGLSGTHARQWLEAAITNPRTRSLLVELMSRGEIPGAAWSPSPTVEAEVAMLLGEGALAQSAVAGSVPDKLLRRLVRRLGDRLVVQAPALVDRLRGLGLTAHKFTLHTGGTQWTDWTDEAWLQWLEGDGELRPGLRDAIDTDGFTAHFAVLLDRLPRSALDQALAQLSRWPANRLGQLADALVGARNAAPELLIQTLDRLPPEDVRRLVHRNWPQLGHQLGLPGSVVQALKPNRSWLGRV